MSIMESRLPRGRKIFECVLSPIDRLRKSIPRLDQWKISHNKNIAVCKWIDQLMICVR